MGVLQQLGQALAGRRAAERARGQLAEAHGDCLRRAARLRATAALAPDPGSRSGLLELADAEGRLAERIAEALAEHEARGRTPADEAGEEAPAGRNHWARLVALLEGHRRAAQRYRELGVHLGLESPPGALFEALGEAEARLVAQLQGLIARADPQAID